uniref:Uncharacterized protein n=1 Tax=Anguilla anguilla TaxID=7936 RepID=A0A0E9SL34_ANGAN
MGEKVKDLNLKCCYTSNLSCLQCLSEFLLTH